MHQSVSDAHHHPFVKPLRVHLIIMLDHVLWLTYWSATVPALPGEERQALEQHLAGLDSELRNALAHPIVRQTLASET